MKKIIILLILLTSVRSLAQNSCSGSNIGGAGGGYLGSTKSLPRSVGETIEVDVTVRYILNNLANKLSYTVEGNNTVGSLTGSSENFSAIGIKNYGGVYMGNDFMTLNTSALGCQKLMLGTRNEMATYPSYVNCPAMSKTVGGHVGSLPSTTNTTTETKFFPTSGNVLASHPIQIDVVDDHSAFPVDSQVTINPGHCSFFQFQSNVTINPFIAPFKDYVAEVKFTLVFYKACSLPAPSNMNNLPVANLPRSQILSWGNVADNSGYEVEWAKLGTQFGSGSGGNATTAPNQITFQLNNLTGTGYKWRVRTKCSSGTPNLWSLISTFYIDQCLQCASTDGYNKNSVVEVVDGQPVNIDDWVFVGSNWIIDTRLAKKHHLYKNFQIEVLIVPFH